MYVCHYCFSVGFHCVDQSVLKLREIRLPLLPSDGIKGVICHAWLAWGFACGIVHSAGWLDGLLRHSLSM